MGCQLGGDTHMVRLLWELCLRILSIPSSYFNFRYTTGSVTWILKTSFVLLVQTSMLWNRCRYVSSKRIIKFGWCIYYQLGVWTWNSIQYSLRAWASVFLNKLLIHSPRAGSSIIKWLNCWPRHINFPPFWSVFGAFTDCNYTGPSLKFIRSIHSKNIPFNCILGQHALINV